jgi:hypothetical protein
MRTLDGGQTWDFIWYEDNLQSFYEVYFYNQDIGWGLGIKNIPNSSYAIYNIWHTADGGESWTNQAASAEGGLCFADERNGWIVGYNGVIMHTDNGGVSGNQEYPIDYRNTMNVYCSPNPFTTSTTLSYELQQPERVSLMIYNHLGQLVYQTKVNQLLGQQELIWKAENYAEGVYYYRLQVGDAVANGKMVKVK